MVSPSEVATASSGKKGRCEEQDRRDWSGLPDLALFSIAMSLTGSLADVLAFGRVCRAWRSVARANEGDLMSSLPPLLFRDRDADFCCPVDGRSYRNRRLSALLEGEGPVEALGCSFGHLIVRHLNVDPYRKTFSVVNPLTGTRACQFPPNYRPVLRWAVVSSPPASQDCVLCTFNGYYMEFCRLGDKKWTTLSSQEEFHTPQPAFLCGRGYLSYQGELAAFDIDPCSSGSTILPVGGSAPSAPFGEMRLCVADAELLQIRVVHYTGSDRMKGFRVYRFNFSVADWVRIYCLGDRALLWDATGATLSENPGRWGGRGNCIYFVNMDDDMLGVFHLESKKMECLALRSLSYPKFCQQSPVWILPSMCY